ncbi:MAG TPA: hypothetical protein VMR17_13425 [Xanthobacteraceae bacterium]|nr:hypothetical protein [Xanthobacteraceae bacterium]
MIPKSGSRFSDQIILKRKIHMMEAGMASRSAFTRTSLFVATMAAASLLSLSSQPRDAVAAPLQKVTLASLTAQGFEIKAVSGNQAGVIGTLVLQREKDVFMCESRDMSIEPTAFECWPVK